MLTYESANTATNDTGLTPGSSGLASPFARFDLYPQQSESTPYPSLAEVTSPFTEGFTAIGETEEGEQLVELLLSELEDEEFDEALEALVNEAAARYMNGARSWNEETETAGLDPSEATEWMEAIASEADDFLFQLETYFADRTIESVTEEELDQAMNEALPHLVHFVDPSDARELFFGALKKKLKKVTSVAKKVVKKGVQLAAKFHPLALLIRKLRPMIRPLIEKGLAIVMGRLPEHLQEPARKLAAKFGLKPASEFDSIGEYLAAELDAQLVEAMVEDDPSGTSAMEFEYGSAGAGHTMTPDTLGQLDAARHRLAQQLLATEPGVAPTEAMEQFLPVAILPLLKTGIALAGRPRVVSLAAGLIAKLISPVVGKELAKPLASQIVDRGISLVGLEAEVASGMLGAEAGVATVEDTLAEVFSKPTEWLENELLLEATIQEAFHRSAARHFPASMLRPELTSSGPDGVWLLMPRITAPVFRYKKYSQPLPVAITRPMAQGVVFSDGETLEEKLVDEGLTSWPVEGEVHAYEMMAGSTVGHLAAGEAGYDEAADPLEFDALTSFGSLPLPPDMEVARGGRIGGSKLIRLQVPGRRLRRKSPVSVRLDLSGGQPAIRLNVFVGERRAQAISEHLSKQRQREVVATFQTMANPALRTAVGKRLRVAFLKRKLNVDDQAASTLANQVFDGLIGVLGGQMNAVGGQLLAAAKDPAPGLTVTASFQFPSKEAIGKSAPAAPTVTIRAGRQRD